MTTQHTPGPWEVSPDNAGSQYTITGVGSLEKAPTVAYVVRAKHIASDTVQANARLIAAAPDLLAALQDILTIKDILGSGRQLRVEAAVAKATGGQP